MRRSSSCWAQTSETLCSPSVLLLPSCHVAHSTGGWTRPGTGVQPGAVGSADVERWAITSEARTGCVLMEDRELLGTGTCLCR